MGKVFVYLYRCVSVAPGEQLEWGTIDAVLSIRGSAPIARSALKVDASLLDEAGFLPYGLSPYELESGIEKT